MEVVEIKEYIIYLIISRKGRWAIWPPPNTGAMPAWSQCSQKGYGRVRDESDMVGAEGGDTGRNRGREYQRGGFWGK